MGVPGVLVAASVASFPMCIDFLRDGQLLAVGSARRRLLRRDPDGPLAPYADLSGISGRPWNDMVADGRGSVYVNTIGFDFPGGEFAPGTIVFVTPGGEVRWEAEALPSPTAWRSPRTARRCSLPSQSYASRLAA